MVKKTVNLDNPGTYHLLKQEGNRYRFITDPVADTSIIDLLEERQGQIVPNTLPPVSV